MILLDRLLVSGLGFVLDKVTLAVDAERNDESSLKEALLEAELRFEAGEIDGEERDAIEREVLGRLRELRGASNAAPAEAAGVCVVIESAVDEAPPPPRRRGGRR